MTLYKKYFVSFILGFALLIMQITSGAAETIELPVSFDKYGLATIELKLNGRHERFVVDTGFEYAFSSSDEDIKKSGAILDTTNTGRTKNVSGEVSQNNHYKLDEFTSGSIVLKNVTVIDGGDWAVGLKTEDAASRSDTEETEFTPIIGREFFQLSCAV